MVVKIERPGDFENAKKLKTVFPNLGNGFSNELSLREIATKIKNFKDKPYFSKYSTETITKLVRIVFIGGEFRGKNIEGLLGEERYKEIYGDKVRKGEGLKKIKQKLGYENWQDDEQDFVLKWYLKGKGPKEIFIQYNNVDSFNSRTYDSIETFLKNKRLEGEIGRQRIEWNSNLGFFALYLLERYGKQGDYCLENTKSLNDYFFDGKNVIDTSKLDNFYRREERKLEKVMLDLAA